MSAERYARIKAIFIEAAELPIAERPGFLDRACAGDTSLRADVEEMLAFEQQEPAFLEETAAAAELPGSRRILERLQRRIGTESRYQLQGEFARGGMGVIFRVWDQDLERTLAMKVVLGRDTRTGDTPEIKERSLGRFVEEAKVTGQLDHPGIVPVHELGIDAEGQVYFTMRLVKGIELGEVFDLVRAREDGWTPARAVVTLLKVCETMAYAHSKGVIHRDLKPSNIMVGGFGEVYVMDWGLARVLGQADSADVRPRWVPEAAPDVVGADRSDESSLGSPLLTVDGEVMGTPGYMSPEQARGDQRAMGPASDVYSVGAILYQLMAGHMPYAPAGSRRNAYAIWNLVREGPPEPLNRLAVAAPAELVAICEKAMAREPADRYPDMAAMAADLQAYVEGRVVVAHRTGAVVEFRKWVQRNRPLAAALAAAVLLLVVGLATALLLREKAQKGFELAEERREQSEANEKLATERTADVLRLSALQDLEDLLAEADGLWPPHPESLEDLRDWIERGEQLVAELPRHYAKREEVRALALPQDLEEAARERASHPDVARLSALQDEIESKRGALAQRRDGVAVDLPTVDWSEHGTSAFALLREAEFLVTPDRPDFGQEPLGLVLAERALELAGEDLEQRAVILETLAWAYNAVGRDQEALKANAEATELRGGEAWSRPISSSLGPAVAAANAEGAFSEVERTLAKLEAQRAELEARTSERRDWRFPPEHGEARWWNAQLTKLIEGLEALVDEDTGLLAAEAMSTEHGWSMPRRLALAERLEKGFSPSGAYAERWAASLPAIDAAYPGLELAPQMGLVPIGPDPTSGLWEFWHVATGAEPERGADGKLVLTDEMGVVLVLLPGGPFMEGAQSDDEWGANYDPDAPYWEGPVQEVNLPPYFLSKYELTQAQWLRIARGIRSGDQRPVIFQAMTLNPMQRVSWYDCMTSLPRMGLSLPTETQWESACRGGTTSVWWTGADRSTLGQFRAGNLADVTAGREGNPRTEHWLDDGYSMWSPVGSFAANPFGLHDVHGNLWEWCLGSIFDDDPYGRGPTRDSSPLEAVSRIRVVRGGSFLNRALGVRSAIRRQVPGSSAGLDRGVRPARAVAN